MPVHDWTRVDAGTFHAFHTAWVTHLSEALNGGLLPSGYYALPEQHLGRSIADVLTLHVSPATTTPAPTGDGGLAVADAPPRVGRRLTASPAARARRRTIAVRHVSGHRVVALVEIVSPANKDRLAHVEDLVAKAASALAAGVHLLLVDIFPPGRHDPGGIHGALWQQLDEEPDGDDGGPPPPHSPLTLAAYAAGPEIEAYLAHVAVGDELPDMPVFLHRDRYVNAPLNPTYEAAFRGLPAYLRETLGRPTP
jgi:hypothetical protein